MAAAKTRYSSAFVLKWFFGEDMKNLEQSSVTQQRSSEIVGSAVRSLWQPKGEPFG
jgi:hypothetical protein